MISNAIVAVVYKEWDLLGIKVMFSEICEIQATGV